MIDQGKETKITPDAWQISHAVINDVQVRESVPEQQITGVYSHIKWKPLPILSRND